MHVRLAMLAAIHPSDDPREQARNDRVNHDRRGAAKQCQHNGQGAYGDRTHSGIGNPSRRRMRFEGNRRDSRWRRPRRPGQWRCHRHAASAPRSKRLQRRGGHCRNRRRRPDRPDLHAVGLRFACSGLLALGVDPGADGFARACADHFPEHGFSPMKCPVRHAPRHYPAGKHHAVTGLKITP